MARGKKKESALTPEEKLAQALVPDWEQPYKVPGNWSWVRLGSFSTNQYGYTAKAIDSNDLPKMLRITDIQDSGVDWNTVPNCEIAETDLEKYLLKSNDIVIARIGATTGKSYLLKNPVNAVFASYLIRLRISESFLPAYVYYFLQSDIYWKQISELSSGIALPGVNSSKLQTMMFPAAPRFEQQRIVDRIEYLFAKLDEAKEKAQSVLDSFETRKAAILHKAFTGELTAKWRAEQSLGVERWRSEYFKDVCTKITDGTHHSPPNTDEGEYMYVTAKNIKEYGVDLSNITYVSKEVHDEIFARCDVRSGDVLYIKDGATTGIATVNTITEPFSLLSSVAVLRPLSGAVDPYYMAYNLNSSATRAMMINNMSGNAITRLTLTKIKNAQIAVCSIDEQQEIVRILDSLFAKEQQAKEAAEAVLEKIDLLKTSILARAFRGELGTNDPSEESALELLKSIL